MLQADLVAAFRAFKNNLVGLAHTALWAQLPLWSGRFHSYYDVLVHILCRWPVNYSVPLCWVQPCPERFPFGSIESKRHGFEPQSPGFDRGGTAGGY
jgi:hypothetical protein